LLDHYQPAQLVFRRLFCMQRRPARLRCWSNWRCGAEAMQRWNACWCVATMTVKCGDPPTALNIRVVDEPWPMGPFAARHHPQNRCVWLVLAGHLHPAADAVRPAATVCGCLASVLTSCAVLPAFANSLAAGRWIASRALPVCRRRPGGMAMRRRGGDKTNNKFYASNRCFAHDQKALLAMK
jgi:hypothetical protein